MFVKETKVKRGGREYVYLQFVHGERDEHGRVRHKVVANLGRRDKLKESGQLEALAGSFARLDPPMAGTRRDVGALLVVSRMLAELDLVGIVDRAVPARSTRSQLSVGEVCQALIASRLCSPSPLYDVAGWASGAAVQELLGIPAALLNDDRLGRALEQFAVYSETIRGAVAARAIERLRRRCRPLACRSDHDPRHAAPTRTPRWWPRAGAQTRQVARQVRALQACTPDGVPRLLAPGPGQRVRAGAGRRRPGAPGRADRPRPGPAGLRLGLRESQDARADRTMPGCVSSSRSGPRAGSASQVPRATSATTRSSRWTTRRRASSISAPTGARRFSRLRARLDADQPTTADRLPVRVAWIHSSEEGREVAAARERALAKAETQLARVQRGLGGRYYPTRKHVDARVAQIIGPQPHRPDQRPHRHPRTANRPSTYTRDHDAISHSGRHRRDLRAGNQPPRARSPPTSPQALQRPTDRRTPPPRRQTITQGPPDLPPQRRPHPRPDQHRRPRAARSSA